MGEAVPRRRTHPLENFGTWNPAESAQHFIAFTTDHLTFEAMRNYAFARNFRSVLFCTLVAAALLVTGCDSSGSNGSADWVGDWVADDNDDLVLSLTEDEIEVFVAFTAQGTTQCQTETSEITNVDGNEVTVEQPDGSEESGTLNVEDNQLVITGEVDGGTETDRFNPIDEDPEDFLGCDVVN